jgi:hypothetical protein
VKCRYDTDGVVSHRLQSTLIGEFSLSEQKAGPLLRGQADGIACRTMEMFEAFGFSERVLKEACWINETTFWTADEKQPGNIIRNGWVQDVAGFFNGFLTGAD